MNVAFWMHGGRERAMLPEKGSKPAVPGDGEPEFPAFLFPQILEWMPVAERLGLSLASLARIAASSKAHGSDMASELIAAGLVDETELYEAIAHEVGLSFVPVVDQRKLVVDDVDVGRFLRHSTGHIPVKMQGGNGETYLLVAPEGWAPVALRRLVARYRGIVGRLRITAPGTLRRAMLERAQPAMIGQTITGLFERFPEFSARLVLNAWQGGVCGAILVTLPLALAVEPARALLALHYLSTFFFLACVALRFAAIPSALPIEAIAPSGKLPRGGKPVYSVLVALYKEAEIVPALLAALDRLIWPRSRLQILLICEQDDEGTIGAIRAARPAPHIEIVEVPPTQPRTKPKALSYALRVAKGDLVVLYDAEDEPHPRQLLEAWQRFSQCDPDVACLQAPLEIIDADRGFLSRMFAFEYRALFAGLLPWLSRSKLLLPLGGTSNHFKRAILDEVGGWDPFNVTEDADLGVRLARFGYRTRMLSLPTREPAPPDLATWLPQRTRWLKGWLQTWFVHMRQPVRLARELGLGSFLVVQILFAGMVISAIVHPMLVATLLAILVYLAAGSEPTAAQSTLLLIDVVNIACGYTSFLLLGYQTLRKAERRGFWKIVLFTPAYWLIVSLAAWRAMFELWRRPHHWDKTSHPRHAATLTPGSPTGFTF